MSGLLLIVGFIVGCGFTYAYWVPFLRDNAEIELNVYKRLYRESEESVSTLVKFHLDEKRRAESTWQ